MFWGRHINRWSTRDANTAVCSADTFVINPQQHVLHLCNWLWPPIGTQPAGMDLDYRGIAMSPGPRTSNSRQRKVSTSAPRGNCTMMEGMKRPPGMVRLAPAAMSSR